LTDDVVHAVDEWRRATATPPGCLLNYLYSHWYAAMVSQ
jgi:hypothetical protein